METTNSLFSSVVDLCDEGWLEIGKKLKKRLDTVTSLPGWVKELGKDCVIFQNRISKIVGRNMWWLLRKSRWLNNSVKAPWVLDREMGRRQVIKEMDQMLLVVSAQSGCVCSLRLFDFSECLNMFTVLYWNNEKVYSLFISLSIIGHFKKVSWLNMAQHFVLAWSQWQDVPS